MKANNFFVIIICLIFINTSLFAEDVNFTVFFKLEPIFYKNKSQKWNFYIQIRSSAISYHNPATGKIIKGVKYTGNLFPTSQEEIKKILNNDMSWFDSIKACSPVEYCAGSCNQALKENRNYISAVLEKEDYTKAIYLGNRIATYIVDKIYKFNPNLNCDIDTAKIPFFDIDAETKRVEGCNFDIKKFCKNTPP